MIHEHALQGRRGNLIARIMTANQVSEHGISKII
jgi:hypothetical protein